MRSLASNSDPYVAFRLNGRLIELEAFLNIEESVKEEIESINAIEGTSR